jgi:STE24 endopeptidase
VSTAVRGPALVLLGCLLIAAVVVVVTVPFPVLEGAEPRVDVGRDFSAAQLAREEAFHAALRPWGLGSLGLGLLVAAVLALSPLGARLMAALPGHWTVRTAVGTAVLLLAGRLVTLPLDVRAEQVLRDYGLSTQSWPGWLDHQARGFGVGLVMTLVLLIPLLALARRLPDGWWLPGAAVAALLVVLGSFVYPVLVEPAFHRFTPLAAGPLRDDLLELARRDGVPVEEVLVADASRRTTALNAYVSGFGSTRRIVVYDTLLAEAPPREVELVVAHELGHAKRNDVLVGTVVGALGAAAGVCGLFLLLGSGGVLRRFGATAAGDPAVVPLVLLLAAVVPLLVAPVTNLVSRQVEARADLHSLELTGDVETFVETERRLALTNLSDLKPHPVLRAFFATHPSAPERIALARAWAEQRR